MHLPTRTLHGAPGGLHGGFIATDDERILLARSAHRILEETTAPWVRELVEDMEALLPEVQRMREEMGPPRLERDALLLELRRAGLLAAWALQREWAWAAAWFAPGDPEAASFSPQAVLSTGVNTWQRRVARLDALRQAFAQSPSVPDGAARAAVLGAIGARLFRATTHATGAQEPVPLGEARQRFDLAYVALRDSVVARRKWPAEILAGIFLDLSPAWRWERLMMDNTVS